MPRTNVCVFVFQTSVPAKKPEMYASPFASMLIAPGPTPMPGTVCTTAIVAGLTIVRLPSLT